MYEFQIHIAGMTVEICAEYEKTMRSCKDYIITGQQPEFHVHATEEDLIKEAEFFQKRNGEHAIQSEWQLERSAIYRKVAEEMIDRERILIHGSALSMDGNGYLFIAPSGTGKSTHAALWRKVFGDRVMMINDDKPLVHVNENEIVIYGTPWDGKHRLSTNTGVPLKAICRIIRHETNSIRRVFKEEGMIRLLEQTYRPVRQDRVLKTLDMLKKITDRIPVYDLYCNMETDAAITAYQELIKGARNETEE